MITRAASPAVSIIMAAYNGAALIGETLDSLAAQTFTDFEVVVVDDRSTDDTLGVLRAWHDPRLPGSRLVVIAAEENGGPVRTRNRAVAAARGRYLAALDQDDLCRPDRLARQVAFLDANPHVVAVGTAADLYEDGVRRPSAYAVHTTPALIGWLLQIENPLVWSSMMIRADAARALDPFTRPDILFAEDFDLYHRLSRLGAVARLDEVLLDYRVHGGGASQRFTDTMLANATRVLREAYASVLGDEAPAAAALVVRHLMQKAPVPDRAALATLGDVLARLQGHHFATTPCDAGDRRLIRWETAHRWAKVARAALRAGTITLADALAVRPDHLGLGHAGVHQLAWSRLVGAARQTFAA